MTTAPDDTDPLRRPQAALRARLARLRRRLRLQLALETALDAAAALAIAGAVLVPLDWWLRLGTTARAVLLAVAAVAILAFVAPRLARRWRAARLDDLALAATLDRFRPGTGMRAADVLQLPALLDDPSASASPALVRLAVRRAAEALEATDWSAFWNRRRTAVRGAGLAAALAVPALFAAMAPEAARLGFARWLLGSDERWPQRTYLSVVGLDESGRLLAPRDEPFAVEVRADLPALESRAGSWFLPGRGEPLALRSRPEAPAVPETVRLRERGADGTVREATMVATGPATFRHELPPSSGSSTFELVGGDDWLGPVRVERVDRPSLAAATIRAREPGTPDGEFREVEGGSQHPVFLPDTEVELTLVGSEPLADARLTVHPGAPPGLGRGDDRSFAARWTLREATTLEVQLTSAQTGLTSKPAFLSLGLLKDRVPRVSLRAVGVGAHVTPVATIPLSASAVDDLGLAAFRLRLERTTVDDQDKPQTTRKEVPIALAADEGRAVLDHQARHDVELQAEPPAVGTILRFVAEAEDRCAGGAQLGRSGTVQMQVVTPDELFYEILVRQRAERTRFLGVISAVEAVAPSPAGSMSAEDATSALRVLHTSTRQLDQVAGRIADTLQEMKLNQVGSPKAHRLLQDGVIDPIRALVAGPAAELREALRGLSGSGPRSAGDAESARRLHGEVVDRMKAILEQMSQWESFVDVVNQVAEVIKMQQGVLRATEEARESRTQEVFDAKP